MQIDLILSLTAFAGMTLIVPGPNNLLLMASGANFGFRATLPHIFGAVFGFTVLIAAAALGLSRLIETYPAAGTVLKYGGAAWLVWFGSLYLLSAFKFKPNQSQTPAAQTRPFRFFEAALFQWVNPGALIIAVSTIGAFAGIAETPFTRTTIICLIFATVGLFATGLWGSLGLRLSTFFKSERTGPYATAIMGLLIVGTAIMIATQ